MFSFNQKKKYINWKQRSENILEKIVNENDRGWNLETLIKNPNVGWNFIKKYCYSGHYSQCISGNPHMTRELLDKNPKLDDTSYFSINEEVKLSEVINKEEYYAFSTNPIITIDIVQKYKNENWYWKKLFLNLSLDPIQLECLIEWPYLKHTDKLTNEKINSYTEDELVYISENFKLTIEDLKKYRTRLYWYCINRNPHITWDMVLSTPELAWNFESLSSNPNITLDIIEKNPDKFWLQSNIFLNPNIDIEYISKYLGDDNECKHNLSENELMYNDIVYASNKKKDIKWRQSRLQKLFISFSPFCEDLDYFFRKWVNYN